MRAHTTHHSSGYQHQLWTLTPGTRAELQHKHLQSWKLTKTPCNLPEKIQMWTIMWKDEVPHFSLCSLHPVNVIHSVMEETVRDDRDVIESWHYWGHPGVVSAGRTRHSWHCIKLLIYTLIFHSVCTPTDTRGVAVYTVQAINETPRLFIFMARKPRDMSRSDTYILGKYLYFAAQI